MRCNSSLPTTAAAAAFDRSDNKAQTVATVANNRSSSREIKTKCNSKWSGECHPDLEFDGYYWYFVLIRDEHIHTLDTYAILTKPSQSTYRFEFVLEWNEIWMFVLFPFHFKFLQLFRKKIMKLLKIVCVVLATCVINRLEYVMDKVDALGDAGTGDGSWEPLLEEKNDKNEICVFVIWSISRLTSRFFSYYTFRTRKNSKQQPRISQSAEHSGITYFYFYCRCCSMSEEWE